MYPRTPDEDAKLFSNIQITPSALLNAKDSQQQVQYVTGVNSKLDETIDLSNATVKTLDEIQKSNEITIEIAKESMTRLAKNREKMKQIQEHLHDIGTSTRRAKRELSAMLRTVACDKCIVLILVIIVLLAALFIVLKIVKPDLFTIDFAKNLINNTARQPLPKSSK